MGEGVSPALIRLAVVTELLVQEIELVEHDHLVADRFKADLRAFAARVETELESVAGKRHLHLADEGDSVSGD